ncbi:MAG: glycoside hydrolase [Burkholderiales bacterium RIFCSPLOWO2_02_FULL_57_36]|nr:MAG: glycoside hydrolase [Burkholderiales bacterium RIFCSPLOWO2_02_FULL_57_36]
MTIRQKNYSIYGFIQAAIFSTALSFCAPSLAYEASGLDAPAIFTKAHGFTDRASELAMRAMALIGIRYTYGGNSPEHGMDCSGLVGYVFKEAWGTTLPRTSEEISRVGERIEAHDLQPGDLVFYNTLKRTFSHVGIYLGDNKFIHSPSRGGKVRIERMDVNYWKKRFNGARRMSDPGQLKAVERSW